MLQLAPAPLAAALAADNIMALAYFPLCSYLGRNEPDPYAGTLESGAKPAVASAAAVEEDGDEVARLSSALALGVGAVALSRCLCPLAGYDLPVATGLTVAAATAFPAALAPLAPAAERLGTVALYLFFATAGWIGGDVRTILSGGPLLLCFLALLYAVHLAVVLGSGAVARAFVRARRARAATPAPLPPPPLPLPLPLLLTASNANIGGPATACALAVGCGWEGLKTPALLVGNLGYAIATPLALLFYNGVGRIG